jgi:SM-20-related protein
MSDAKPPDAELALNPQLDWESLSKEFGLTGRLHIDNVLTEAAARRLHYALVRETPWRLFFNEGERWKEYHRVSADQHQEMAIAAWERAHSQFQYFYHQYQLLRNGKIYPESGHYLCKFVSFVSSTQFLSLMQTVTGVKAIDSLSSAATLYKPLDFLTAHNDHGEDRRLVAYVLNMTPEWRPDWGGALQFYNESRDQIVQGFLPTFNALNLFRVPMWHSVTQVAAFGGMRYAISGWLERQPPPLSTGTS